MLKCSKVSFVLVLKNMFSRLHFILKAEQMMCYSDKYDCWKGTTLTRMSPFNGSKKLVPNHLPLKDAPYFHKLQVQIRDRIQNRHCPNYLSRLKTDFIDSADVFPSVFCVWYRRRWHDDRSADWRADEGVWERVLAVVQRPGMLRGYARHPQTAQAPRPRQHHLPPLQTRVRSDSKLLSDEFQKICTLVCSVGERVFILQQFVFFFFFFCVWCCDWNRFDVRLLFFFCR